MEPLKQWAVTTPSGAAYEDETVMRRTLGVLKMIQKTLEEASDDLSALNGRVFGPIAGSVEGSTAELVPNGMAGEIAALLEHLQSRASTVASQARGLNQRI